jgi:hypothetical protein
MSQKHCALEVGKILLFINRKEKRMICHHFPRLCNQSALSPSVEQLLERVVESGGATTGAELSDAAATAEQQPSSQAPTTGEPSENISDRLERLSSAFDAIQKYLEEQTGAQGGGSGGNVAPGAGGARTLSGTFTKKKHPTELR